MSAYDKIVELVKAYGFDDNRELEKIVMNCDFIIDKEKEVDTIMDGWFSVPLVETSTGLTFWLDVRNDGHVEWNDYIFMYDNDNDLVRRAIQEEVYNFDYASTLAVEYLENNVVNVCNTCGVYFIKNKDDDFIEKYCLCKKCKGD